MIFGRQWKDGRGESGISFQSSAATAPASDFHGSFSIKSMLPVPNSDLGYDEPGFPPPPLGTDWLTGGP
jgi:hypothetical protein